MKTSTLFLMLSLSLLVAQACKPPRTETKETTRYYLIRHAEKAVDGTDDPDLSADGQARAMKLVSILKENNIERLYATSYKRTQQTLQPLADALHLEIMIYDHQDPAAVERMLADCKGKAVVIAGHSNTIPDLANKLIGAEKYEEIQDSDYTRMWEIVLGGDKVIGEKVTNY